MQRRRPYLSQNGPLIREPAQAARRRDETNQPCARESTQYLNYCCNIRVNYLERGIHVDSREKSAERLEHKDIADNACRGTESADILKFRAG